MSWYYKVNNDDSARFTLGKLGKNNIVCIGINPSTATPDKLDPTIRKVEKITALNDFDGWVMINVYPQRATNPNDLDSESNFKLHQENLLAIKALADTASIGKIWACWGNLIQIRPFLYNCLNDIVNVLQNEDKWVSLNGLTKMQNPKHPLYLPYNSVFEEFNINEYINLNGERNPY
ncbi:DUF1643 domain-containing protein [Aquirufa antheringensis]|jgi:hypothetical protein|uniref:DUF1643 domain-containing protein n=1 Tax=Aquirufa antheringensis TaxID=2516559 RepID=A0A4Q9BGW3_9BACT|nr:DUF1643 domain-containing protein [Aquirufa antheringensis]MCZ2477682.1 DUF1643 domain-containing protein [Aquirufa antheringensis]MCZ2485069.1 DUF1643 domain-containing protein [Aquirufa antheringensis]TBH75374.1 DUF1643 domain-containing protein [Aquirufa antheringensis]